MLFGHPQHDGRIEALDAVARRLRFAVGGGRWGRFIVALADNPTAGGLVIGEAQRWRRCRSRLRRSALSRSAFGALGCGQIRSGRRRLRWFVRRERVVANDGHVRFHGSGCAFGQQDLLQDARNGAGHFRIDLVSLYLDQRLVAFDTLARLLQPAANGTFRNRLTELGHFYDGVGHCLQVISTVPDGGPLARRLRRWAGWPPPTPARTGYVYPPRPGA